MPELPEVETIRADLQKVLRGQKIRVVQVNKRKLIKSNPRTFDRDLRNCEVESVSRRGKLLIFKFKEVDRYLLIHLKMTGQLIYKEKNKVTAGGHGYPLVDNLPNRYSHIIFSFVGGSKLYFNDMRQFGYMKIVDDKELKKVLAGYGMEPLTDDFTWQALWLVLQNRKTALKNVLLDQKVIAGLGNIYVDETCFAAGIRPTRRADRLSKREVKKLGQVIRRVLNLAIKYRGTTFGDYRDGLGGEGNFVKRLKVYGRAGMPCRRCGQGIIKKIKVGGRGTSYCPICQS